MTLWLGHPWGCEAPENNWSLAATGAPAPHPGGCHPFRPAGGSTHLGWGSDLCSGNCGNGYFVPPPSLLARPPQIPHRVAVVGALGVGGGEGCVLPGPPPPALIKKLCCSPGTAGQRFVSPFCSTRPLLRMRDPGLPPSHPPASGLGTALRSPLGALPPQQGRTWSDEDSSEGGRRTGLLAGYEGDRQALKPPYSSLPSPSGRAGPGIILRALQFAKHVHVVIHLKSPNSVKEAKLEFHRGSETDPWGPKLWMPNTMFPLSALLPLVTSWLFI